MKFLAAFVLSLAALNSLADVFVPGKATQILTLAPDHGSFRVVWNDIDEPVALNDVRTVRLFPDGTPDPSTARTILHIPSLGFVAAGATNAGTFVLWTDEFQRLRFAPLEPDGSLSAGFTMIASSGFRARLACNANRCAAIWRILPITVLSGAFRAQFFDRHGNRIGDIVTLPAGVSLSNAVLDDDGLFVVSDQRVSRVDEQGHVRFNLVFEPLAISASAADDDGNGNTLFWIAGHELKTMHVGLDGTFSNVRTIIASNDVDVVNGLSVSFGNAIHLLAVAHGRFDPINGAPVDLELLRLDPSLNVVGRQSIYSSQSVPFSVSATGWNGSVFALGWAQSRNGPFSRPMGSQVNIVATDGLIGATKMLDAAIGPPPSTQPIVRRRTTSH